MTAGPRTGPALLTYSGFGAAYERTILSLLREGLPPGPAAVSYTPEELALGAADFPFRILAVLEGSGDALFHLSSQEDVSGAALESFVLPAGRSVTPGVVPAILAVPFEHRRGVPGNPLAEPNDLSSSLDFWQVALTHVL